MVGRDVDAGVVFVPGGEVGVCFGFDGAQGTGDEGEYGCDLGFAVCHVLVEGNMEGIGKGESTS